MVYDIHFLYSLSRLPSQLSCLSAAWPKIVNVVARDPHFFTRSSLRPPPPFLHVCALLLHVVAAAAAAMV
jgi:hypothetical protein